MNKYLLIRMIILKWQSEPPWKKGEGRRKNQSSEKLAQIMAKRGGGVKTKNTYIIMCIQVPNLQKWSIFGRHMRLRKITKRKLIRFTQYNFHFRFIKIIIVLIKSIRVMKRWYLDSGKIFRSRGSNRWISVFVWQRSLRWIPLDIPYFCVHFLRNNFRKYVNRKRRKIPKSPKNWIPTSNCESARMKNHTARRYVIEKMLYYVYDQLTSLFADPGAFEIQNCM